MIKIGLTGGIGSGKSTISNMLKNKGIKIIDADIISRQVLSKYPQIIEQVMEKFGNSFIDDKGDLKRREFGNFIFKYEEKRKLYESIIIPFVNMEISNKVKELEKSNEQLCVIDAPTLIEHGLHRAMDYNILVWVDKTTQLNRVMKRDSLTEEQALNRINSQMPLEEKKREVNFIIDNSGEVSSSKYELDSILEKINKH